MPHSVRVMPCLKRSTALQCTKQERDCRHMCAHAHCSHMRADGFTMPQRFLTSLMTRMKMMLNTRRAPPTAMIRMTTGSVSPLLSRHHLRQDWHQMSRNPPRRSEKSLDALYVCEAWHTSEGTRTGVELRAGLGTLTWRYLPKVFWQGSGPPD